MDVPLLRFAFDLEVNQTRVVEEARNCQLVVLESVCAAAGLPRQVGEDALVRFVHGD